MTTTIEAAREAVAERLNPAVESLQQNVRAARRTIVRGQRAAEDLVDDATLRVRRRPLTSLMVAGAAGALAGCMVGFALGRQTH